MCAKLMLDPSLLVCRDSLGSTFNRLDSVLIANDSVYVPRTLMLYINHHRDTASSGLVYRFFIDRAEPAEPAEVLHEVNTARQAILEYSVSEYHREKHQEFYENLRSSMLEEGIFEEHLLEIVFEEWVFLQEESWLVARIRHAFDEMVSAGGMAIECGRILLDKAVKKTIKKKGGEIDTADRLRALGKWIAVGGIPLSQIVFPVGGVIAGSAAGLLLLFDP